MNLTQCAELRDHLFATRFSTGELAFRYMAVLPGGPDGATATVHYAYARPVWERAGEQAEPEEFLNTLLSATPLALENVALQYHAYLKDGWPIAWGATAKDSSDNFPVLLLLERPDGSVTGAVMRDPHCGRTVETLADRHVELEDVEAMLVEVRALNEDERYFSWYKDGNIQAESLTAAIEATPETSVGQKEVLIYRENEWFWGIWTTPEKRHTAEYLHLMSVADFHGTRVSAAKLKTRPGLETLHQIQTIPGDSIWLAEALDLLRPTDQKQYAADYEQVPAVKKLCAWWNAHAPEEMRFAAHLRAYIWDAKNSIFVAGDPEEPALAPGVLEQEGAFSIFEKEGRPRVVLQFYRGKAYNTAVGGGTQIYLANGKESMDIGLAPEEVDEAYYALKGLQAVQRYWR